MKKLILSTLAFIGFAWAAHAITVSDCSFSNPSADRILFWDDSAGDCNILTPGTGLSITGTTLNFSTSGDWTGTFDGLDGSAYATLAANPQVFTGVNTFPNGLKVLFSNALTSGNFTIEQQSTGDTQLQFLLSGVRAWVMGIDNSDSDKFKISAANDGFASPLFSMTTAGAAIFTSTLGASNLSNTNTGDQTSIVGITGTKAQFDTAVTDGNILYVGDVTLSSLGLDADLATFSVPASTTISAFGASLVDDTNAAASIATFGLDADLATFSLPASTTISAFGASLVDDAASSNARTTLGLIIGTDVQAFDAALLSVAGVSWVQGDLGYWSGTDTAARLAKDTNATRYLSNTGTSNNPAWAQIDLSNGVTSDLPFANLTQGSARSVLGVAGNATADVASIQGTTDQVLRVTGAGTGIGFGAIDLSKSAAATGVLQAASFPALTGDVTTSAGAVATTIANDAVTYAKMQNISATSRVLGRITAGAGDTEELTGANIRTISGLEAGGTGDIWVEKAGDTMTGGLTLKTGSAAAPSLIIGTAGLFKSVIGGIDQITAYASGADSSFAFQNGSASGFSGPSYLDENGLVNVFTGYQNSTGEFRFNNVAGLSGGGKTPTIDFRINSTSIMKIADSGNIKFSGSATRGTTEGTNHLDIFDGTAPVGTLANGMSLYSTSGIGKALDSTGNISFVNNVRKYGRSTAQTAAVASVAAYTVGAADGTFEISANVLVTAATLHNFTVTCAYTDEGNTARTLTLPFSSLAGTIATAIANAGGAVPYEGVPLHIRAKASTAITIATTGTFTTTTYNVEGMIRQMQ